MVTLMEVAERAEHEANQRRAARAAQAARDLLDQAEATPGGLDEILVSRRTLRTVAEFALEWATPTTDGRG